MARRSVAFNHLERKIDIVQGDIKEASRLFGLSSFDVVTSNPSLHDRQPWSYESQGREKIARHEIFVHAGRCDTGRRGAAASGRKTVSGTPALPAGGDHNFDGKI